MKKYIAILLVAAMATLGISACRKENSNKETKVQKDSDIKVVTTIFPEYDWVRQIAGEEADHKDIYQENASAYSEKLKDLDAKYQEVVDGASQKTLLFGDRFPFRYLVDDYGLSYYAAFVGCSAESEASFDTISFLANKVDELGLKDIMAIENSNQKIAKTIIENTKEKNQKILTLDTMQSTTSDDVKNGTTYLSVMEKNLEVLKEALQ